jgi:hypothetical protein
MKKIKSVVKVKRSGFRAPEYVLRIDRTPIADDNQPQAGIGCGETHRRGRRQIGKVLG